MKEKCIIITWPEIQDYMDKPGFEENSCLINEEPFFSEYGFSAYFVRESWAEEANKEFRNETVVCENDGKLFHPRHSSSGKFCCKEWESSYKRRETIRKWKLGEISGTKGYSCSTFVRNYLMEKYNGECQKCGWGEINPYTGKIPLQVHHIDGDSLNNIESNLQLLCPNCHSLTENFGSRNKNAPRGKTKRQKHLLR